MYAFQGAKLRRLAAFGSALAILAGGGLGLSSARAQAPAPAPAPAARTAQPGWYGYVPGRGWVSYAPPSTPAATSVAAATTAPPTSLPPGWAGYSPATGWTGYAPASSPTFPGPAVRPPVSRVLPADGSRRRAASRAVNRIAPELSYTLPAYREFGTGRPVPLAKPWLPASP